MRSQIHVNGHLPWVQDHPFVQKKDVSTHQSDTMTTKKLGSYLSEIF